MSSDRHTAAACAYNPLPCVPQELTINITERYNIGSTSQT